MKGHDRRLHRRIYRKEFSMKRIAVLAVFLASQVALAQPPGAPGPEAAPEHRLHRGAEAMKDLNLSDKQMEELHALRTSFEKKMIETQSQIRLLRVDIRELAGAETPDRQAIEKKLRDISDLQLTGRLALVDHLFKAKAILTPDQQKKFRRHMIGQLMEDGGMPRGGNMMKHRMMQEHGGPGDN
jgi:Spy/CpxP family protein refolding chaperone